jgi:transposase
MTSSKVDTVHVITSVQRRRRWSVFEKKAIVEETYEPGKSVSYVARKHGIAASQVFMWRRKMEEGALVGIRSEENVIPETEHKQALERIKRLERLLGQKTEEVEILKEAIKIGREKKLIWHKPLPSIGGFQ